MVFHSNFLCKTVHFPILQFFRSFNRLLRINWKRRALLALGQTKTISHSFLPSIVWYCVFSKGFDRRLFRINWNIENQSFIPSNQRKMPRQRISADNKIWLVKAYRNLRDYVLLADQLNIKRSSARSIVSKAMKNEDPEAIAILHPIENIVNILRISHWVSQRGNGPSKTNSWNLWLKQGFPAPLMLLPTTWPSHNGVVIYSSTSGWSHWTSSHKRSASTGITMRWLFCQIHVNRKKTFDSDPFISSTLPPPLSFVLLVLCTYRELCLSTLRWLINIFLELN